MGLFPPSSNSCHPVLNSGVLRENKIKMEMSFQLLVKTGERQWKGSLTVSFSHSPSWRKLKGNEEISPSPLFLIYLMLL